MKDFINMVRDFFRKLRGKPAKYTVPQVQEQNVVAENRDGIGKFTPANPHGNYPPEVTVGRVGEAAHTGEGGWPPGTSTFGTGYYVPYRGQNGGPFTSVEEAKAWMVRVDQWFLNSQQRDNADNEIFVGGMIPAKNVSEEDAAYLYSSNYIFQDGFGSSRGNLFWDFNLVAGSRADVNFVVNTGERVVREKQLPYKTIVDAYQGQFKYPVSAIFQRYGL